MFKMKILVLAKRFTSGKDSVKDNFGRVIRLFEQVSGKHEVTILEADHLKKERFDTKIGRMKIKVVPFSPIKLLSYYLCVKREAAKGYDMIYATSHPAFGAVALFMKKIHGIPTAYDIQDNYEAYTGNPLFSYISDSAAKHSKIVSCASNIIAEKARLFNSNIVLIPNGYNPSICKPLDKNACRKKLKLPLKAKIIAYTGSPEHRGIESLLKAFEKLKQKHKNIYLLLVGSGIKKEFPQAEERIIMLESMPYEKLLVAINAADAMVMPYPKNKFTEAMLAPYKLVEYMACCKPIVLSDVGEMKKLAPRFVFRENDIDDMNLKIEEALKCEKVDYRNILKEFTWKALGERLSRAIDKVNLH